MRMPITAFLVRSLRVGCRVGITYTVRVLMALVTLASLAVYHFNSPTSAPGLDFFLAIIWTSLAFLSLFGLGFFATVITEEREEMTLGLLKMTGLSAVSILLGKSVARLLDALLIILAQVPFVLLAVTLGGVSTVQIAAGLATILAWAVLLSGLGLLCSVCSLRSETATRVMAFLVLLFFAVPLATPLLDLCNPTWRLVVAGKQCLGLIVSANPFIASRRIAATGFSGPLAADQVWLNIAAGVVLFLLAWACFDVFTREGSEVGPSRGITVRGGFAGGRLWRGRAWSGWALIWKDFYFVCGGPLWPLIRLLLLCWWNRAGSDFHCTQLRDREEVPNRSSQVGRDPKGRQNTSGFATRTLCRASHKIR